MKDSHRGHGRDVRTTELSQLLARGGVDVDEAVHIADDEFLDARGRGVLPLRAKTVVCVVGQLCGCFRLGLGLRDEITRQRERGRRETNMVTHLPV